MVLVPTAIVTMSDALAWTTVDGEATWLATGGAASEPMSYPGRLSPSRIRKR